MDPDGAASIPRFRVGSRAFEKREQRWGGFNYMDRKNLDFQAMPLEDLCVTMAASRRTSANGIRA